jgi:phage-related baseplate assembly protein
MATQLIDMSKLPPPQVVEVPDFEAILADLKADLIAAYPDAADTLELESEPLTKWLQRLAYQLVIHRSKTNDSAIAIMLAYAKGTDLDHIGLLFDTPRLTIVEEDLDAVPPVEKVMEEDDDYRERIHLAPRGYSVAGPEGAYVYFARSASGQVLDARATSPAPGQILISVLSRTGDGTADADLLATVAAALSPKNVRPMTDEVIVDSATIVNYTIEAEIITLPGPDAGAVIAKATTSVQTYAETQRRIGRKPTLSGIIGALQVAGVHRVDLIHPTDNPPVAATESWRCNNFIVTPGGTDE